MKTAIIYTKPSCPYCVKAKQILNKHGIKFSEKIVGVDATKQDIENAIGGGVQVKTVPQIFVDGEYVGGCTDLMSMLGE